MITRMRIFVLFPVLFLAFSTFAQTSTDEQTIRKLFDEALSRGHSYQWLDYLSNQIGGRLSGSPQAAAAVEWSRQVMDTLGFDRVYLQEVMVPRWVRGDKETARIVNSRQMGSLDLNVCALGGSVGTGPGGITAEVVEVKSLQEVKELGRKKLEGKIVFYNRPMDPAKINTFEATPEPWISGVWALPKRPSTEPWA
jgi:carboxypeptidase Q